MSLLRKNILSKNLLKNLDRFTRKLSSIGYGRSTENPTAGIIVIGDEILKAQVKDTNSNFICKLLYGCGVRVKKISVVGDEVDRIAEEMIDFSNKYTHVITSGGIGPTHDDVTFEALGKAFDDSLHYHPDLVEVVKTFFNSRDIDSPSYKLAYIPTSASLVFGINRKTGQRLSYPCIRLKNVHVFPGSPIFLQRSFENLFKDLFATDKNFFAKELYLDIHEEKFADALSAVSKEFPHVTFGSYPTFDHSYYQARVTVESSSEEETDRALERFRKLVPSDAVVDYDNEPAKNAVKKFEARILADSQGRPLYEATLSSLKKIYGEPSRVAICFDGSIEATVILHLAYILNEKLHGEKTRLQIVYLRPEKSFSEVDDFVNETVERYKIRLEVLNGPVEAAIKELRVSRPEIGILLLGSNNENLESGSWSSAVIVCNKNGIELKQVLDKWTRESVWRFARSLSLPYCKLYDRGYSSLSFPGETERNAALVKRKIGERIEYYKAHVLDDLKPAKTERGESDL